MSYIPLANITLTSAQSSVTFGSIPTSVNGVALRDLVLVVNGNYTTADGNTLVRLNGDSGSNYSNVYMAGGGAGAGSGALSGVWLYGGGMNTTAGHSQIWNIMDYSATNKHKTVLNRSNEIGTNSAVYAWAGRWANTSAVTSVYIQGSSNFAIGSSFALYGIAG
ncbi:MAG: hypothetical protein EBS38_02680 [Actinobacteria bacterium]|nr:hypothetical protein [Actinomycetota bacterium]